MKNRLSQHQRMLYKMALTPQMRHSIQLLGMSTKDLNEYIDSVAASNPFLQKILEKKTSPSYNKERGYAVEEHVQAAIPQEENPRASLVSQLKMSGLKDKVMEIAEYLIYEMDENGYINIDPEEVADELFAEVDEVQEALEAIQALEPAGLGAGDVRECLQIQLKRRGKENSLEYRIVTDFINDLVKNNAKNIAKELLVDAAAAQKAIANIKKLNPRPASTLLSEMSPRVIPDLVAHITQKKVTLEINKAWLPRLKLYNPYENKVEIIKDDEAKRFLKENMEAAKGLIDGVKRREETMCRIAEYVLKFQKEAFLKNKHEIKTLTIKHVAEALKLHPSTISRALSNKYIQINDEVTALNSLLSHGIKKENGETTSKTSIKNKIREIVKAEDASRPLNDTEIKEKLEAAGISIKRRTVAKYRESLRILPSHLRKKHPATS
jgi:RNA polymerase sigma-54 factor